MEELYRVQVMNAPRGPVRAIAGGILERFLDGSPQTVGARYAQASPVRHARQGPPRPC
jgi:hypothetical protein